MGVGLGAMGVVGGMVKDNLQGMAGDYSSVANPAKPVATCAKCGAALAENAKFCLECGEKVVPAGKVVCPHCGELVNKGKFCLECGGSLGPVEKVCSSCGHKFENGKFCPECGTKVD